MRAPFLRHTTLNVNHVCLLHVYKNVRDGKLEVVPPPVRPVEEQQQIRFEMQQEVCSEPAITTVQARECDLIWGDAIWSCRVKNMSKVCEELHPLNILRNNCKKTGNDKMMPWSRTNYEGLPDMNIVPNVSLHVPSKLCPSRTQVQPNTFFWMETHMCPYPCMSCLAHVMLPPREWFLPEAR